MTSEVATNDYNICDACAEVIPANRMAWMVPTGKVDEEFKVPVVHIICHTCYMDGRRP